MPDQISVSEFVSETNEDYKSPTASNFTTRMAQCRNTVAAIEEVRRGAGSAAPRPGGGEQGATGAAGSRRSLPARPRAAPPAAVGRKRGEGGEKGGGRAAARLPPAPRAARPGRGSLGTREAELPSPPGEPLGAALLLPGGRLELGSLRAVLGGTPEALGPAAARGARVLSRLPPCSCACLPPAQVWVEPPPVPARGSAPRSLP